jgi:hypothetical protein
MVGALHDSWILDSDYFKINNIKGKTMWKCEVCKREFLRKNQAHSCVYYPLENHFKNKEKVAKPLFDELIKAIEKNIGPVKIESLPCCIHLVGSYSFGGVWALKDKIKIDFRTNFKIEDPRVLKELKISPTRYMYHLEIKDKTDIDAKLLGWLKIAYNLSHF